MAAGRLGIGKGWAGRGPITGDRRVIPASLSISWLLWVALSYAAPHPSPRLAPLPPLFLLSTHPPMCFLKKAMPAKQLLQAAGTLNPRPAAATAAGGCSSLLLYVRVLSWETYIPPLVRGQGGRRPLLVRYGGTLTSRCWSLQTLQPCSCRVCRNPPGLTLHFHVLRQSVLLLT